MRFIDPMTREMKWLTLRFGGRQNDLTSDKLTDDRHADLDPLQALVSQRLVGRKLVGDDARDLDCCAFALRRCEARPVRGLQCSLC